MECEKCGYQFQLEEGETIYRNNDNCPLCYSCTEKERLKAIRIVGSIFLIVTGILLMILRGIPFLIIKLSS